jgi:Ca-activated chloride channel homolog
MTTRRHSSQLWGSLARCGRLAIGLLILATLACPQDDPVFRTGVSLVRVDAQVTDSTGALVEGLTKDDFRVLDEGAPQTLVNFSFGLEPLDLILLFDTAGSMHGKLLEVVRATQLGFNELHKGDRVSVRVFGSDTYELLPFSENLETVNQAILIRAITIRPSGSSKLEPAADAAALRFREEKKSHRKRAILIITDKTDSKAGQMSIVRDLWASDAVLSELVMGGPQGQRPSDIVDQTGGTTIVAGNPGEAFRESVHYLRSGYTMYYALPEAATGTARRLDVQLTPEALQRHPNVRVRARSGYNAP